MLLQVLDQDPNEAARRGADSPPEDCKAGLRNVQAQDRALCPIEEWRSSPLPVPAVRAGQKGELVVGSAREVVSRGQPETSLRSVNHMAEFRPRDDEADLLRVFQGSTPDDEEPEEAHQEVLLVRLSMNEIVVKP